MATLESTPGGSTIDTAAASKKPTVLIRGLSALWTGSAVRFQVDVWLGEGTVLAIEPASGAPPVADVVVEGRGLIGMPGLVDCHTHSVWAGTRLADFVRRVGGESYASILEGGGGIHTTVAATSAADEAELGRLARARLATMLRHGVTTVEVKSGYGLTTERELRLLRVARSLAGPQRVVTTFLGAHAVPPGVDRAAHLDELCGPGLAACAPLADAVDIYCDRGAYTLAEAARLFAAARALGLPIKAHAEQVAHTGVAALAARAGALSCDHLERADADDIAAMAASGTVAVLLPGAMLYLRDVVPPVAALRAAGVPMAVATDLNPGSSPLTDLWAAATLACLTMGLTPEEALAGITAVGARALGRPDLGRVEPGAAADLALFAPPPGEVADPRVLVQYLGGHEAVQVFIAGVRVR